MKEVLLQKFMGRIEYSYKLTSYNSLIVRINRRDNLKSINRSFDSYFQIRRNFLYYLFSIPFMILEISYKTENSSFSLRLHPCDIKENTSLRYRWITCAQTFINSFLFFWIFEFLNFPCKMPKFYQLRL